MNGHYAAFPNDCAPDRRVRPDDEIVLAARTGSPVAFTELHGIYSRRLYNVIVAITKNPEDAEDALQETFLRAFLGIHSFEGRSTIYSWLTRIAINSALMILRKRRARSEILLDLQTDGTNKTFCLDFQDTSLSPEEVCDFQQRSAKVTRAIHKLSPHIRETLRMRIDKEATVEEISHALKISGAAVKSRLHRARRQLSARYDLKRLATNYH
jgi:RNA polymerase sigma-70 factor (ECF subfamily)